MGKRMPEGSIMFRGSLGEKVGGTKTGLRNTRHLLIIIKNQ